MFSFIKDSMMVLTYLLQMRFLKELPIEIMGYILEIKRYEDGLIDVDYARLLMYESEKEYLIQDTEDLKLSNALAKLWLKLKKKGYIK